MDSALTGSKNCRFEVSTASSTGWPGRTWLRAATRAVHSDRPSAMTTAASSSSPSPAISLIVSCFTGAAYRVFALVYDGRRVGRLIIGPFLPATVVEAPATLLNVDPGIERERAQSLLLKMPRAKLETVTRIAAHLKASLDLILFSGHKAFVTSQMHLLSVRESYRQLEDKTARLQEAFDKLKELDRLKSNFLATVSHELRTPLTSIIGYSEMLTEGLAGELTSEQLEFVKTIHAKGGHLLSLIMSLLDMSKLESGTMRMREERAIGIDSGDHCFPFPRFSISPGPVRPLRWPLPPGRPLALAYRA